MRVGLDVGSTTIKCVVLDEDGQLLYSTYQRHFSHITEKTEELLSAVAERFPGKALFAVSGSAGMGMAEDADLPFVQEVFATRVAAKGRTASSSWAARTRKFCSSPTASRSG